MKKKLFKKASSKRGLFHDRPKTRRREYFGEEMFPFVCI